MKVNECSEDFDIINNDDQVDNIELLDGTLKKLMVTHLLIELYIIKYINLVNIFYSFIKLLNSLF